MKKLSLRIDELAVESFDTSKDRPIRGTVAANATDEVMICTGGACSQAGTYCNNTCESTCWQDLCDCTGGGAYNTTCDVNLTCGVYGSCPNQTCEGPQDNTTCNGG